MGECVYGQCVCERGLQQPCLGALACRGYQGQGFEENWRSSCNIDVITCEAAVIDSVEPPVSDIAV